MASVNYSPDVGDTERAAALLGSMANEKRLTLLCALLEGERSVNELAEMVSLSQPALSQHLSKLRAQGLVQTRREAQHIFYRLSSKEVRAILETLHDLFCNAKPREAAANI